MDRKQKQCQRCKIKLMLKLMLIQNLLNLPLWVFYLWKIFGILVRSRATPKNVFISLNWSPWSFRGHCSWIWHPFFNLSLYQDMRHNYFFTIENITNMTKSVKFHNLDKNADILVILVQIIWLRLKNCQIHICNPENPRLFNEMKIFF